MAVHAGGAKVGQAWQALVTPSTYGIVVFPPSLLGSSVFEF